MTERPILFSGEMVRAILDGRKTQTRRVVGKDLASFFSSLNGEEPDPDDQLGVRIESVRDQEREGVDGEIYKYTGLLVCCAEYPEEGWDEIKSPHGQPGDRLWVKETYRYADWTNDGYPYVQYQADGLLQLHEIIPDEWSEKLVNIWAALSELENYRIDNKAADRRWRPSIFMPHWASRIALEIVSVRAQRVQDITNHDAKAEGTCGVASTQWGTPNFQWLWDSINAKRGFGWEMNPWVWVIEFKKL